MVGRAVETMVWSSEARSIASSSPPKVRRMDVFASVTIKIL